MADSPLHLHLFSGIRRVPRFVRSLRALRRERLLNRQSIRAVWRQTKPGWWASADDDMTDEEANAFLCATGHHEYVYDAEETAKPYTGYIERCIHCDEIVQVPQ